jgi:hypothetical protein
MDYFYIGIVIVIIVVTLISSSKTSSEVSKKYDIESKIIYLETHRSKMSRDQIATYTKLHHDYMHASTDSKLTSIIWFLRREAERDLIKACEDLSDFYKTTYRVIDDIEWKEKLNSM